MSENKTAIFFAVSAAALYALNVPMSKLLMSEVSPTMLAGFLYLGAGVGIAIWMKYKQLKSITVEAERLDKSDLPYTIAMVLLDIVAPIFLMYGIADTNSANVSLLNNFEIVATSVIAWVVFKEKISVKLWGAITLVITAGIILSYEGMGAFVFNRGSVLVLCACICWGIENNCTRNLSQKSSEEIVLIKGVFSGVGSIGIALGIGEKIPDFKNILVVMMLGFVAYGLSINFYIMAQKSLGAAKTSVFYSVAPFLGVGFSFLILGERPAVQFYAALGLMLAATVLMVKDALGNEKILKEYQHTHEHKHGNIVHTHSHMHLSCNPIHIHTHVH